ncbi:hypothetical protein D8T45_17940 [Vibrio vulnificus]|nr:hypothetical protein D8T45_17940 [Vibrio vulnificus]RZR07079.1 hypothetical protein D8T24_23695 [Vibrio vulnificus]
MSFGGESSVRKVGLCGIHPLTQRYVPNPLYVTWAVKFPISYEIGCV